MTVRHWFTGVVIAGSVAFAGCGGDSSTPTPKPTSAEHAGAEHAGTTTPAGPAAQLAKLPAADKALAEAQKVCPISGEPLGSMGVPPKLSLNGETVFLCCNGCAKDAKADPDKTLKALAAKKAEAK
ncbi:MAG TPA: hypothetical protein VG122_16970 [Gemmata sp.]|jgi:Cu(I)/Ag(I) efflux system membrane fusion protein|nr:hypothetical protein [Gemmata sp.]